VPPLELPTFLAAEKHLLGRSHVLDVHSAKPARNYRDLVKWIDQLSIELAISHVKRPTLEDVFIESHRKETAGMIRSYIPSQAAINVKLTFPRPHLVIFFFNYLFPLVFFFYIASVFPSEQGGAIIQVLTMCSALGDPWQPAVFVAGIQPLQDRESEYFAPLQSGPDFRRAHLWRSLLTGLLLSLPSSC